MVALFRAVAEQVFSDYILPLPSSSAPSTSKNVDVDDAAWTDRLLNTMKFLDDKGIKSLLGMAGIKSK
jgi:sister-chromatid-cohesion protein PDS5